MLPGSMQVFTDIVYPGCTNTLTDNDDVEVLQAMWGKVKDFSRLVAAYSYSSTVHDVAVRT